VEIIFLLLMSRSVNVRESIFSLIEQAVLYKKGEE